MREILRPGRAVIGRSIDRLRAALLGERPTPRDAAVLQSVELESERFAAWSRVTFLLLLSGALAFWTRGGMVDALTVEIIAVNVGLSLGGVLLSRGRRLRAWAPWALGLSDVAFILVYLTFFSRFETTIPGFFKTGVVVSWGAFLALALTAMRGRPWLLAAQTALFAAGLALATRTAPAQLASDGQLYREIASIFGPGENTARITILVFAGAVLSIATLRSRVNLHRAVAASRRAAALSDYLAPAVASVVADTELDLLRAGRQQEAAVLFADVRGFTAMSEALSPRDVAAFLTDFRRRAAAVIEREGGVVDKFIGDEVMGLFGIPTPAPDDARRAERAGRRMLAAVRSWNRERARAGRPPVRIGVGLHHGPVFVGAIGDRRLEFTVLGDTVNVARRLEQMTKTVGHDFLVSEAAHAAAGVRAAAVPGVTSRVTSGAASGAAPARPSPWLALPEQAIRGHREPVRILAYVGDEARFGAGHDGDQAAE